MSRILVADDEHAICQAFTRLLRLEGHTPVIAASGEEALEQIEQNLPDVVFLDIQMPGMGGLETLEHLHASHPELPVIVMTAYGTMDTALKAMQLGAFDYLGKPVELAQIRSLLQRALHQPEIADEPVPLPAEGDKLNRLLGQSARMQEVFKLMGLLTGNDLTVLITGESGVGKELVAQGIHDHGPRSDQPFVAVNCAAIPEQLLESELFGHEKGAFTSANERRAGRFEAAAEGTLFLDEIGELPLHLQGKLLRVLQEHSFERIGSSQPQRLRARLIAATNRNLEQEVTAGRFREDLYHRLNLVNLQIPPLRLRQDDIELLARHFLQQANRELGRQFQGIEQEALACLREQHWPGNVRELEHVIKRSCLLARGPLLTIHDLVLENYPSPSSSQSQPDARDALEVLAASARAALHQLHEQNESENLFHQLVQRVEQELISEALQLTGGNQVTASSLLGIHRTTLRKKMGPQDQI